MKKKLLFLLSSVAASVALVGTTFAAWLVTDNADPKGVKISPKEIEGTTITYSTMLLEWGQHDGFTSNVENLELGEKRELELGVKSKVSVAGSDVAYSGGDLTVSLVDLTETAKDPSAPNLVDNLTVKVYETRAQSGTTITYSGEISSLALGNGVKTATAHVTTPTSGQEKVLYVVLEVPESVGSAKYNQMLNDVVYLSVDWNKPEAVVPTTTQALYYRSTGAVPTAYLFKKGSSPVVENDGFPGVAMTAYDSANGIYTITADMNAYDYVIFSIGSSQTDDLLIPDIADATPYWTGTAWAAAPAKGEVANAEYYLVGSVNGWLPLADYKLTSPDASGTYSIDLTVPANGLQYKVLETVSNTYYGYSSTEDGTANCSWDNPGDNITIRFNPGKTLDGGYITNSLKA